jgi:hypothetical protein
MSTKQKQRNIVVEENTNGVVIKIPASWAKKVGGVCQITMPCEDADLLADLITGISMQGARIKADELANRERIARIMADPSRPESDKVYRCEACKEMIRYDDWEHTHQV